MAVFGRCAKFMYAGKVESIACRDDAVSRIRGGDSRLIFVCAVIGAILWMLAIMFFVPDPKVGMQFEEGVGDVSVRQIFEDSGHFHLEVHPKEAAAKMTAMTIAGIPVFSKSWLVYSVASTVPLGESEIVDFPRFFNLLPKLFMIGRVGLALLPLGLLLSAIMMRIVFPKLRGMCGRKTFLWVLGLTTMLSLPEPVMDTSPGLDSSWNWLLCRFAFRNVFGSDVVFTYGPLGFLLVPQESWACVLLALVANLAFSALWIRFLWRIYRLSESGRTAAWLLSASVLVPMPMEWRWVSLAVLHGIAPLFAGRRENKYGFSDWIISGVLAAFVSLMKFSSLTIVVGSQCFCLLAFLVKFRRDGLRGTLVYMASLSLAFLFLSMLCFSSFQAWILWIRGSVATAEGYNLFMVAEKQWFELSIPIVVAVLFLVTVGWRRFILFAPIMFLTAKYAWVRQSAGPMAYVASVIAAICLLDGVKRLRCSVALFVFALAWSVVIALPGVLSGLGSFDSLLGTRPIALCHTLALPQTVRSSFARSKVAVEDARMPSEWLSRIASSRVAFFPTEYGPGMACRTLDIAPLPSLQLYSACHPYLDELNADFFERQVPDYVVLGVAASGCGHSVNYPRTCRALITHYEFMDSKGGFALLARREIPRAIPLEVVSLPCCYSLLAKVRGTFLRNPMEYAKLVAKDGRIKRFQYVRGNQGVYFPLAWIPFDDADLLSILQGGNGRVVSMHLGQGAVSEGGISLGFRTEAGL